MNILTISAEQLAQAIDTSELAKQLAQGFRQGVTSFQQLHYPINTTDHQHNNLFINTSYGSDQHIGIKLTTQCPDNNQYPKIQHCYLLFNSQTGNPIAIIDGDMLTYKRAAATSALAAKYLAKTNASNLLMIGAGRMAYHLIDAHCKTSPIKQVTICSRNLEKAQKLASEFTDRDFNVVVSKDIDPATEKADIICCATPSKIPLLNGELLMPGCHLDIIGGQTPDMRETDDVTIQKAHIFVDDRQQAIAQSGDLAQPLEKGSIDEQDIRADLVELTQSKHPGRESDREITLFKSVGTNLADLITAEFALEMINKQHRDN